MSSCITPSKKKISSGKKPQLLIKGELKKEIKAYKQAICINPDHAPTHVLLGFAYGKLGRYRESIEAYKQAIRIDSDDAMAHYGLGLSYLFADNNGSALEQYKILKTLDKDTANKLFNFIYKSTRTKKQL